MDLTTIRDLVKDELSATDTIIEQCLASEIPLIKEVGQHLIHSGGKRLRPMVVLLSSHAFNYQGNAHIELAAVIEMIHTATLLHDDVIDTSELRRGQKTANELWGNPASVLVGDFLYSRAFQVMVGVNNIRVMATLANSTNTIAGGEILQLLNCKNPDTTETEYMNVIRTKTGTLFSTAAELGAIISARTEAEITAMKNYGMHLGIAFQLIDDALDYSASTAILGKNAGDDLAEGKPTLPLIHALKHGTPSQVDCIREAILNANRSNFTTILQAIESTEAIAYTHQLATQHIKQAQEALNEIPGSIYQQALFALTKFAIDRDH